MSNYIGKIAAVGTINMSQVSRGLQTSAKEYERYGKGFARTISQANADAARSFSQVFTQTQRLERAINARSAFKIDTGGAETRLRAIVGAAEDIAKPLSASARSFERLSAVIQNEFGQAFVRAGNAAETAQDKINRGVIRNTEQYQRYKRVVDDAVVSVGRLAEAGAAVSGLATGRELRFQQAGLAAELQRSAASQAAASALPVDARRSGAVAQLVELQRREAEEATRLLAVLENVRNTRRGDVAAAQAAQAALDGQVQRLGRVNAQLEQRVRLEKESAAAATRAFRLQSAPPRQQRGLGLFGASVGTEAEQAIERARRVSVEFARLPEAARGGLSGLSGIAGRVADQVSIGTANATQLNAVLDRLTQGIASATAASRAFTLIEPPRQQRGLGLFGASVGTEAEQAIERARRISEEYARLPDAARQGLAGLASIASRVADQVEEGTANARQLNEVLDRTEVAVNAAAANEADQRRRREVATTLLPPVLPPPRDPAAERTAQLQGISDRLGPDIASAAAEFSRLEAATVQVKNQIDQLPAGVRTRFIPAIRDAENELLRLAATDASPAELERATQRVVQLRQEVTRTAQASTQLQSIGDVLQQIGTAEAVGQLNAAARVLAQIGATADGPVAQAYERLRLAQQRFIEGGTSGTPAARREIERLQQAVAQAAAATGRISFSKAFREIQRGGDIARGNFGNVSLAVQQAAFAFDDFFSVTGDISQRIRAAGNNISQLGFIVGGTQGLIAGIAISIGSQAVAALIKFANSSVEAQDRTKTLNDALSRQKSTVDELAQSYQRLTQASLSGVFSNFSGSEFQRGIRELERQQRQQARDIAADSDPTVVRERAFRASRERELQAEQDVGRRIALQQAIETSRQREQAAANDAAGRRVTPDEATAAVVRALERLSAALVDDSLIGGFDAAVRAQRQAAAIAAGPPPANAADAARLVREQIASLAPAAGRGFFGSIPFRGETVAARREIENLQPLLDSLDSARLAEINRRTIELIRSSQAAGTALAIAQEEAAKAAEAGIPSAARVSSLLEVLGNELREAQEAFGRAGEELAAAERLPAGAERDRQIQRATDRRGIEERNVQAVERAISGLDSSVQSLRDLRLFSGDRFSRARIDGASGRLSSSGFDGGQVAAQIRSLQSRQEQIDAAERRVRSGGLSGVALQESLRAIERQRRELNQSAEAISATVSALERFSQALARAEQAVDSDLQSARQRADQARDRVLGRNDAATRRERDIADRNFLAQQSAARNAREAFAAERARIERESLDPRGPLFDTFRELDDITARLGRDNISQQQREELLSRRSELESEVDRTVRLSDDVRIAEELSRQTAILSSLADEGRALARTPGEAAAESLLEERARIDAEFNRQQGELINRAADARLREEPIPEDEFNRQAADIERRRQEFAQQSFDQQARQVAPLLVGFSDEVQNALLQGPSRAALGATDASTLEGQRELNRLLRGDDPAKDVNLLELQKQTRELERLVQIAEQGPPVAE
jgi:hypothetical protein